MIFFFTKSVSICKNLTVCSNINGCNNIDIGNRAVIGGNTSIDPFNSLTDVFTNIIQLTSNMDNVCDVLLLTAEKTGSTGTGNIFASISWQEIY